MQKVGLKDENGKIYYGWWIVLVGFIAFIFGYTSIVSVTGVFVLPVTEELGFQIGDFTVWMTIQGFSSIAYLLVVQKLINEKTIKPIMIISALCGAAGMLGFAKSTELWHFYLFAVLLGIGMNGLTSMPCTVLANNWFGSKVRGVAISLIFGGCTIGAMIIIPILNKIVLTYGWRSGYMFIAAGLVLCALLVLLVVKWSPEKMGISKMGVAEEDFIVEREEDKKGISFKQGIRKPSTWLMFLSGTLVVIASVNILIHTVNVMVSSGFSATFGANVVSICGGIVFIGSIIVGHICDRGHLQACVIATSILFAMAYIGQLFIPQIGMAGVLILVIGYGFGCPAVNVISPLLVNHMYGQKDVARYVSFVNMFISFGAAIGASLIGKLLDTTGSYTIPFLVCAGCLIVAGIIRTIVTSRKFKFVDTETKEGNTEAAA